MLAYRVRFLAAAGAAVLGLSLAACSSSSSSSSASSSSSSSGSSSGAASSGTSSSAGSASTTYPALAKYITGLEQRPTSIGISTPVGAPIPKGKTIAYVQCGSPACVVDGDLLQQAVNVVGWKMSRINAGLTVQTIQEAWQQAVSDHPDAVITSGTPRSLFNPELAQLAASHIPVVDLTTADTPGNGLSAVFGWGSQWSSQGKIIADYMLVNDGGKPLHELSVNVSAYPNISMISTAVGQQITANCSSCTTDTLDVPVSSIGTDLASRIVSYLSAHPDVNWVYVGFADMMTGLPSALSAAGLSGVHTVTIDHTAASNEYLANGQSLEMFSGFDLGEMMWRSVDYLARLWTGKPTAVDTNINGLPLWVVTKAGQPTGDPTTGYFPFVANYQSQYESLWGVSK